MNKGFKHVVSGALCTALLAGCLTGCSFGEKVTAESLMENAFPKDMSGIDADIALNFDCDLDLEKMGKDLGLSGGEGGSMEMSMGLDANLKQTEEAGVMDGKVKVKMLGISSNQPMTTYFDYDKGILYSYDKATDSWSSKEIDSKSGSFEALDAEDFEDLQLQKNKDGYTVTAKLDYDGLEDMMGSGIETTGDFAQLGDFSDMEMTATFEFAKDKTISEINIEAEPGELDGVDLKEFTFSIKVNEMGDDIEVEIPDDVVKSAVPDDTDLDFTTGEGELPMNGENIPMDGDASLENPADGVTGTDGNTADITDDGIMIDNTDINAGSDQAQVDIGTQAGVVSGNTYGTYNNNPIVPGFALANFTNDGWAADSSDTGIFIAYENPKYEGADLYLYSNSSDINESYLGSNGVYGYNMDVTYCKGAKPAMTFNGLSWGASRDDIVAVYGTPADERMNNSADAIYLSVLRYELADGTELEFSVSPNGLSRVAAVNYSAMD